MSRPSPSLPGTARKPTPASAAFVASGSIRWPLRRLSISSLRSPGHGNRRTCPDSRQGGSKRPVPSRPLERADKDASGRSRSAPFRSRSQVPRESLVARTSWSCGPLSMIACQPLKARRDRERPAALDRAPVVLNRESAVIECAVATHAKQVVTTSRCSERFLSRRARSIRTGRRRCRFPRISTWCHERTVSLPRHEFLHGRWRGRYVERPTSIASRQWSLGPHSSMPFRARAVTSLWKPRDANT